MTGLNPGYAADSLHFWVGLAVNCLPGIPHFLIFEPRRTMRAVRFWEKHRFLEALIYGNIFICNGIDGDRGIGTG